MHGSVKGITTKQKSNNISFVPHLHCLMSRLWFIIIANYKFAKRRQRKKLWCGVISYKFYGYNLPTFLWKISEWSEFLEEFYGILKCKLFHCRDIYWIIRFSEAFNVFKLLKFFKAFYVRILKGIFTYVF